MSLRYFNAAGASFDGRIGEDWTYSINLIPLVMKAVLLGDRRLQIFGDDYDTPDGTCIRDYIHVDDLADAHIKSLAYLAGGGETVEVNVGTGNGSSVLDVIKATEAITGRGRAIRHRRPTGRRSGLDLRRPDLCGVDARLAGPPRSRRDHSNRLRTGTAAKTDAVDNSRQVVSRDDEP